MHKKRSKKHKTSNQPKPQKSTGGSSSRHLSIVFYTWSTPFHPGTIYTKGLGGSESAIIYLSRELAKLGHRVWVFCNCDAPGEYDGVTYRNAPDLPEMFAQEQVDVFVSSRLSKIFLESIPARLKCLWSEDSYDQPHIQCLKDPALIERIDRIITVSGWQAETYMDYFRIPAEKFFISRNGFNPDFFTTEPTGGNSKRLVYTSTPFRGLDVLLDLFPNIRQQVPDVELYIYSSMSVYSVSREKDEETYGPLYRKAEQPGVKLMGSISQDRLAGELLQARLMAYPNHFAETSCIAAIEAQAAGAPVITTESGGLTETVQHRKTGILIPGDSRSPEYQKRFVQEIIRFLKDQKGWSQLSRNARQRAFQEYRWEVVADEWSRAFDQLLTSGQKQHAGVRDVGGPDPRVLSCQNEIKAQPENPELYNKLGGLYMEAGEEEKALTEFRNAVARNILYEEAYNNYEKTAGKLGLSLVRDDLDIVFYAAGDFNDDSLITGGVGGSESAVIQMSRMLRDLGRKVIVFNETESPGACNGIEYRNHLDFYFLNRFNKIPIFISSRILLPFKAGVRASLKILWAHDECRTQFVHDEDIASLNMDEIFTLSQWHKNDWSHHFKIPSERFYVTRNGVNPEDFDCLKGQPERKNKIIYASRPSRGLGILLALFPEVRRRIPEAELHIFTDTPAKTVMDDPEMAPYLSGVEQPGVFLRGSLPKPAFYRELLSARVMAYPSIWRETSCIAAIEAQAAGLPVVTSSEGALPETIQGGLVIPGDPTTPEFLEKFVSEVCSLMEDDQRWEALSRKGKAVVRTQYRWSQIAVEWLDHFESLPVSEKIRGKENIDLSLCMIVKDKEETLEGCLKNVDGLKEEICMDAVTKNNAISPDSADGETLTVCMMVKNEEEMLARSLESIKGHVHEIIIVDTGSSDRTVEIAKKYTDKIYFHPWENDFSKARNQTLQYATSDWILILDADEKVGHEDAPCLKDVIQGHPSEITHLFMDVVNYHSSGSVKAVLHSMRIFRNRIGFHYEGIVHNELKWTGKGIHSGLGIHHYGYALSKAKMQAKADRTIPLIKKQIEQNPGNPWPYHNLCVSYVVADMMDEGIEAGLRAMELADKKGIFPLYLYYGQYVLASAYCARNEFDRAIEIARRCLKQNPYHLDSHFIIALSAYQKNSFDLAREMGETYLQLLERYTNTDQVNLIPNGTLGYRGRMEKILGHVYFVLGQDDLAARSFHAAIDHNLQNQDWPKDIGLLYHGEGKVREAMEYYRIFLDRRPDDTYILKAMADCLRKESKMPEAVLYYDKVLKLCPDDQEALYLKQLSLFEKDLSEDPENIDTLKAFAFTALEKGDMKGAEKFFLSALELNESDPDILVSLCSIYLEKENLDACLLCCETLLRMLGLSTDRTLNTSEDLSRLFRDIGDALLQKEFEKASNDALQIAKNISNSQTVEKKKQGTGGRGQRTATST